MEFFSLVWILFLLCGVDGCWKSSPPPTPSPTPRVLPKQGEVFETVQAKNVKEAHSARSKNSNKPSTSELKKLSEELLKLDHGSTGSLLRVNHQGKSRDEVSDAAPQPLFSSVPAKALQGSTVRLFQDLLNNYEPSVTKKETETSAERQEQKAFLDAIMKTEVMKKTQQFLQQKRLIKGPLRPQLETIWFTPYSRHRGLLTSSGFEHVFLGELKNGAISGFHNWIFFYKEEKEKDVNYKGYIKSLDLGEKGEVLKFRFNWLKKSKPVSSMFIGTSPELEMALYTVCFYSRPNANCNIRLGGQNVSIKVYHHNHHGTSLVGSAFPNVY